MHIDCICSDWDHVTCRSDFWRLVCAKDCDLLENGFASMVCVPWAPLSDHAIAVPCQAAKPTPGISWSLWLAAASPRPSSGEDQMSWITHKQDRMFGKVVAKYRPLAGHVGLSWSHLESALECDLSPCVSCVGSLQPGYEVLVACLYTGKPLYFWWSSCPSWHFATTFLVVSDDALM